MLCPDEWEQGWEFHTRKEVLTQPGRNTLRSKAGQRFSLVQAALAIVRVSIGRTFNNKTTWGSA
jgi:hypothetical protein